MDWALTNWEDWWHHPHPLRKGRSLSHTRHLPNSAACATPSTLDMTRPPCHLHARMDEREKVCASVAGGGTPCDWWTTSGGTLKRGLKTPEGLRWRPGNVNPLHGPGEGIHVRPLERRSNDPVYELLIAPRAPEHSPHAISSLYILQYSIRHLRTPRLIKVKKRKEKHSKTNVVLITRAHCSC